MLRLRLREVWQGMLLAICVPELSICIDVAELDVTGATENGPAFDNPNALKSRGASVTIAKIVSVPTGPLAVTFHPVRGRRSVSPDATLFFWSIWLGNNMSKVSPSEPTMSK